MTNYSERLGLLIEAIVVREAAGTCPVTGEPHPCENRDETDGAACEGCDGPEMAESRAARVGAIFEAARKQSKAAKKAAALKDKFLNPKTGGFKGRKGEKFKNCAAYMKAKGGVKDPKALCGSIARKKAMGEATELSDVDKIDNASLQKLAAKVLRSLDVLAPTMAELMDRRSEVATHVGEEIYKVNKALDTFKATVADIKAGKVFRP